MKTWVFFMLALMLGSNSLACKLRHESVQYQGERKYFVESPKIYVVKVMEINEPIKRSTPRSELGWAEPEVDGHEIVFKTIRMIKGTSKEKTFKRKFIESDSDKNEPNAISCGEIAYTFKVGSEYIFVPDRPNIHMVEPYSEKREKEIRALLEGK